MKKPSMNRKDKNDHYTLENCQIMELGEHVAKDKEKAILQYDKQGNYIREWKSARDVDRNLHIAEANIGRVISGIRKSAGGFKWFLKT